MKIFGRTPAEYACFAAIPLVLLAAFATLRVDLYRHSLLRSDGLWLMLASQATLLFFVVRVRLTRFGDFKTLLPLVATATATLVIVDAANRLAGRAAPDNVQVVDALGLLAMAIMILLYWALGSIILALLMTRARMALAGLFVFLF